MSLINNLKSTSYYISSIRVFLGIKTTEQVCILSAQLILPLDHVVKVIRIIVKYLGDDEGAFPGRG